MAIIAAVRVGAMGIVAAGLAVLVGRVVRLAVVVLAQVVLAARATSSAMIVLVVAMATAARHVARRRALGQAGR
jgi:hypothetical protein